MAQTLLRLLLLVATSTAVGSGGIDPVAESIRRHIEVSGEAAAILVGDEPVHAQRALPAFYEARGFAPAWSRDGRISARARQLVAVIAEVDAEGLRPTDYHFAALSARLAEAGHGDDRWFVETDLLLTDAFLILAAHLVSGRVDPATFDPTWIATRREVDVTAVLERVVAGESPRAALRALRPDHPGYERLIQALAHYRELAAAGGWPRLGPGPSLKPGASDASVALLRRRLAATDDLDRAEGADRLDDPLVEAVIRFQRRHGLDEDGVVGPATREALDVGPARRVRLIELNLERWRWLPRELGQRYLLVNVPEFRLHVTESGQRVLSLRVVVGRTVRSTPVFSDLMRYVVFRPSWDVPPTILRQDKLPAIRQDPRYVIEQNFLVFRRDDGRWIQADPLAIDWAGVTPATIRLRQRPGPQNALGLVKFMFPNPFHVYLHDTPAKELFDRSRRDFSSGCIRVERPDELATYLLSDDPAWSHQAVLAAMQSGQERTVMLPRPMPVHIEYWTAWASPEGSVEFRRDLYGRDARLDAALRLPPPSEPDE